jgi:hypothetical protein
VACHRRCRHCYDDRFRPYAADLDRIVGDERRLRRILANLPADMSVRDPASPGRAGAAVSSWPAASF